MTVSPRSYVLPIETASRVNLGALKRPTGQALAGLPFIGMVDFGLFKSWGENRVRKLNDHVSVNTHVLVFGATIEQIKAGFYAMGIDFTAVTRRSAGFAMAVEPDAVEGDLLYLLKAPLFYYKVESDHDRGNLTLGKHTLRPGDQLRMAAVLHDMFLDELFFGQHAGTTFVRAVRTAARAPLVAYNRCHPGNPIAIALETQPEQRALLSSLVRSPPAFSSYLRRFGGSLGLRDPEDDGRTEGALAALAELSDFSELDNLVDL